MLSLAAASLEAAVAGFNRRQQVLEEHAKEALNARQTLALLFMLDVAPLSSSAFAELTGASQSAALSDLADLVRQGLIERVGQARNTRYRVTSAVREVVEQAGV